MMKKTIMDLIVLLAFTGLLTQPALHAQCGFKSDINLTPQADNGVYCSYDTVKMSVVEPFDGFQWYYITIQKLFLI